MTEQDTAQRARNKSERKCTKGKNEPDCRRTIREKGAGKNQGSGSGIEKEVIPFNTGAGERGECHFPHACFYMGFISGRCLSHGVLPL